MKRTLSLTFLFLAVAAAHAADPKFHFVETKGEHLDVKYGDRNVLRFVNKPRDGATKDTHYMSFKPFHQVFDPKTGETLLSSGAHPNTKEFQFPHHRGLFFGFNKITYGDKKTADIWHGTNNVYSTCDKMLAMTADDKTATHTAAISWHGSAGDTFATEQRTVTAYAIPGGTQIDWSSTLSTELPKVRLDGDPQHAGFHFRATQEVSKTNKQTYYLRPDGKGMPGETRNWDAKGKNPLTVNLPWNAMSFVTGGKRYTALRINHPDNPKETRGSERDYGRFGDYFEYDLTPEKPLKLKYRVWVQEGEMTKEDCEARAAAFAK
jgi:Methane oxygenase PmoA